MLTARETRFLGVALAEAGRSGYHRVKIGSVIERGGYILTKGANLATSHPLQKVYNQRAGRIAPAHNLHSELHAIVRGKGNDLSGSTIYVARLDKVGRFAMCRPCCACILALQDAGIRKVIYTTPQGIKREDM